MKTTVKTHGGILERIVLVFLILWLLTAFLEETFGLSEDDIGVIMLYIGWIVLLFFVVKFIKSLTSKIKINTDSIKFNICILLLLITIISIVSWAISIHPLFGGVVLAIVWAVIMEIFWDFQYINPWFYWFIEIFLNLCSSWLILTWAFMISSIFWFILVIIWILSFLNIVRKIIKR